MTLDNVQVWLHAYVGVWRSQDPRAIGALFTEDATYSYHPWDDGDEVAKGPAAISSPTG